MKLLCLKALLLLFTCCYVTTSLKAQQLTVKGIVNDGDAHIKLKNSSVAVLNAKDSTLVRFTRTNAEGAFLLNRLCMGKYILLVTYPGYADYVEQFRLDSTHKDMGNITLMLKANLLKDIVIKGNVSAIKIKGDTTEYNAGSFRIQPNAKVEDLLKQLPGIQVDKDGKITAQGQTVTKVLVDGEEFFGDDPTLVTKNLRGDMVDKVQVYDKKSDQATFTGIDDGVKDKTINLKLKEDKKNGYFGRLDGGGLASQFYQGQGLFNYFKGKKKVSAYSTVGNTGRMGLNWSDANKIGAGSNTEVSEDGMIYFYNDGNDELDRSDFRGSGVPETQTGGAHYDNKWNKDKHYLNANYKAGHMKVVGDELNLSQNNLPSAIIRNASGKNFNNSRYRQKLDLTYQFKPDSTSSYKLTFDASKKNNHELSESSGTGFRTDTLFNITNKANRTDGNSENLNTSFNFSKRLKKKGRTYSFNFNQALSRGSSEGFLNSSNIILQGINRLADSTLIDQKKINQNKSTRLSSGLSYTEPLYKTYLTLALNYNFSYNTNYTERRSLNSAGLGKYTLIDSVYSSEFDAAQYANQGGLNLSYKRKKVNLTLGTRATDVNIQQTDLFNNRVPYDRHFVNWSPQLSYNYKFSNYKSFRFNYNGRTVQPSMDQLQLLRSNTDPFNIWVSNPNLKASFNHSFGVRYNSYKVISEQSIYFSGNFDFTENPIVNSTSTDLSTNINTYESLNLSDKRSYSYYAYAYYYRKIKKLNLNINVGADVSGNTYYSLINNQLNQSLSNNYSGSIYISTYKEKKYDFSISFDPGFNTNESSVQKEFNNNGWNYRTSADMTIYLPKKFELATDARYDYREKTSTFSQDFERLIWNARIVKKFFKADNLTMAVSANDLLNQNNGFDRWINNTMITQRSYTTIKRYVLVSMVWEFNKMGLNTKKEK